MMRALGLVTIALLTSTSVGCGTGDDAKASGPRVIVLGLDGMDYALTKKLMDEGRMPNFSKVAQQGSFAPLETSVPPQSPVAWSNFITGLDSGGHGIYDFVHRDPDTMIPYLSTSRTSGGGRTLEIGKYQFPLSGGSIELLRKGRAFWEVLEDQGIQTTILRMPANFPPTGTASYELSGMGTPDITGSYGEFSFYTSKLFAFAGQDIAGGEVYEVDIFDGVVWGGDKDKGRPVRHFLRPVHDRAALDSGGQGPGRGSRPAGGGDHWIPDASKGNRQGGADDARAYETDRQPF